MTRTPAHHVIPGASHQASDLGSVFPYSTCLFYLKAMKILKETKNPPSFSKLRYEQYNEGTCVQIMYLGAYDDEPPTIAKIHKFAEEKGYSLEGKHHEIYLSDPRRVEPERLKTILRQPIIKS